MAMHKLQEWGFSADWWRNQRGEYWVVGQTILSIAFVLLPVWQIGRIPPILRIIGTIGFGSIGLWLLVDGLFHLKDNLTPLPHPKDESSLVTSGAYRFVRHPIYSCFCICGLADEHLPHDRCFGLAAVFRSESSTRRSLARGKVPRVWGI